MKKDDFRADALANLYRSALYLGRRSNSLGLRFLSQANKTIPNDINDELKGLINAPEKAINHQHSNLYWAEKVLDSYHLLKRSATRL